MLRHGGSDLKRLTELREERFARQHALQDAEQVAVAAASAELRARAVIDTEREKLRLINDEIDRLLDKIPRQEKP